MEKEKVISAIKSFNDVGITSYGMFCRGGNYELRHNGKDNIICCATDFVVHLKPTDSYENLSAKAKFEIDLVPYENIDYIFPIEITYDEANNLMGLLGVIDPTVKEFFKNSASRFDTNTRSNKMEEGDIIGNDGKPVNTLTGRSAYVVAESSRDRAKRIESEGKD